MGFSDFWLQFNNGKKEQLKDAGHGVRKEQLDPKFASLFEFFDQNGDGVLEEKELQTIFDNIKNFAGDNVLDSAENSTAKSIFADQIHLKDADLQGFVKSVSDASKEIVSSEEKATPDGGKEIKTEYKDGTISTITYYSNGDFKCEKLVRRYIETKYVLESPDGKKTYLTKEEYDKALKDLKYMEGKFNVSENFSVDNAQTTETSYYKELEDTLIKPHSNVPNEARGIASTNISEGSKLSKITNEIEEPIEQVFSPRAFAESLGVNVNTAEGKKILERLSHFDRDLLKVLKDGAEIKELLTSNDLAPTFDNISNVLEIIYGITLRDEEELKASKPQMEKLINQIRTAEFLADFYSTVAGLNDQYTDSLGLFGLGSEGIGYLINKLGLDGENHYQWADSCREFAKRASDLKVLNPEKFNEGFKKIYGENSDKWGIDFNEQAFKDLFALIESGKAVNNNGEFTDEYKAAILKAVNFVADNPNESTFNQVMNGLGETIIMIVTLGWGAETKAGQMLASSTYSAFSRAGVAIASKQVNNKLLQGTLRFAGNAVKLIGPAINEGTKMYTYSLVMGTGSNVANRSIKFNSEENSLEKFVDTEAMVLDNAKGSFGFGAFAGAFGSTVTQKVMQRASRVSQKVGTALADKFAKGAVDANEVFTTILEKSAPTKIAEVAAFVTDVLGFTAFESVLAIVNNLDNFPDGYSVEDLTNIIWEELKSQGYNLGQIKIVAWFLSSRSARMQASKYMRENPQFKGATVEKAGEGFKINLPDGRKVECKNTTEMITAMHLISRDETALSKIFDKPKTNAQGVNNGVNEGTKPVEPNHESYRISIPIRLKSKMHDEFHVTGNTIYYRNLGEWQERGLTREQMIREEFDVSKFSDSDWEEAYTWLDKIITNVEKIDKSFDGILPSLTPATYYRGMIVEPDSRTMRIISDAKPGDVIVPDTGYAWGTPNEKYAEDFAQTLSGNSSPEQCVIMKIKTGAGVSLSRDINISLDNIELNPYTNVNVVFRRMAQYRVLEKEIKDGKVYITLEYLGVEKHNKTNNGTPNTTYSDFTQKLYNIGKKAEVYELSDGRKIVKVKSGLVGNKFDFYEFDSKGNLTEIREKVSGKEADKIYNNFEDKTAKTIKKGSGTLSMGGLGDLTDQANANDAYNKFKKALFNQPLVETLPQKIARKLSNGEIYELHIENLLCKSINDNAEILEALIRLNNKDANYDRITGFPLHFIPQKLKEMVKRNSDDAIFDRVTGKNIKEELLNFLKNNFNKLVDLDDLQAYTILLKNLIRRNVLDANYDRITGLPLYFIPQELKEMVKRNRGDANFDRFSGKNIKEEIINFLKNNRELIFSELLPKQYYEFSKLKHELANILENNILDILGIKNKDAFIENLARSIIDVRVANNIEATELIINNNFSTLIGDDIHIRIEDKKGYIYKVDKSTGAVTSINKGDKTLNIDTGEKTQTKIVYEPITTRIAEPFVSDENAPKISHKLEYIEVYRSSADGKDITYEKMRESKVPGNYEIYSYITTPDGQLIKDLIGLAEYDGKGGVHIEKNVKSLNGTMTQTVYADDAQGNRFSYYKITDVNGNILYESTEKFKKLSEDHYQSFSDGQGYDIQYSQDKVVITKLDKNNNLTDEKIEYTIRDFTIIDYSNFYSELNNNLKELEKAGTNLTNDILDSKDMQRVDVEALLKDNNIQEYTIDRKLIPMLKGLAGEDYFNLRNHTKILIGELPAENIALSITGGIVVSKEHYSKLSTLLHEAGHEHTFGLNLLDDTELNSIYEREKAAFLQTFPDETIATLAYFLSQNEVCQVNPAGNLIKIRQMRGLNETSAETKLITKYHSEWNVTQARTALLQQYFPETIACIARKMKANATVQNENVRIATVNGIADPSPENAPEQSSHIETHFETISPDAAEKVIYNSIIHNSEENVEKFHGHIYPKSLLSYCEIDGKVSKELVDIESELLLKFPLGSDYKVMTIMDLFKTKSGIDRLAIKKFKELSTGDYEKDEKIADKLKSCKDSQGRFREDYYSKLQQIESPEDKYAYWVLDGCKVNGDIDESIWAKVVELQSLGFSSSDIWSLIKSCRTTDSSLKIIDFSDELYQRVLDLKRNHNVPNGEISQIIDKCKTKDGAFNEEKYNFAIELSSHIDNDIANCVHWLIRRCENKEELFNRLDEMKNKYGIKDDYKRFYELSCDIIQDGKVVDDTPWNAEYTLRFNKDKFKRVMNLASELKTRSFQLQTLIKYCYMNGKFDEATYNTILNLYRAGMTDGVDLQIIGDCIYERDRGETSIVNHKLMEKLAQWFISYVEIKSAQEPNKDINIIKNNARIFVQRMIGKINNTECEATEYIQKFIDAGLIDNIGEILEVASIKDNKANDCFQEPENHYDKKVMDRMLSLQNKYKLDSEDVNKAINYLKNNYEVENLTSEEKFTYLESLDKLFDASGSPKDLLEQIKKAEMAFELNMILTPECLDSYTKYMKQGVDFKTIDIVENFSCPEKYKDNPDVFIDKVLSFINSLPKEMQKYPKTLCNLEEWADIITETVKQNNNEQFIKEYMHMLQYQIATYELETPEFRQNVIHILECAKEHPDKLREIETVLEKTGYHSGSNYGIQEVCLKNIDRYEDIFEAQHPLKTEAQKQIESTNKNINLEDVSPRENYVSGRSKYLIVQLDKAGLPLDEILKIVDTLTTGNHYDSNFLTPDEVINKMTELYHNKKLDMDIINVISRFEPSEKLPELIDYIVNLKENNVIQFNSSEGFDLAQLVSPPNGYKIYDNYKEIVDFYIKLKNENVDLYNSIKNIEDRRLIWILNACGESEGYNRFPNSLNVDVMQKIVDYVKLGINSDIFHLNSCGGGPYGYNYENIKNFVGLLDKVNMSEYKDEIIAIHTDAHYKIESLVDPRLTKESLDFILDIQKLLLNSEHLNEPQILNSDFISVFVSADIPEAAYNKIRFYIESTISIPGTNMGKFNTSDVIAYARTIIAHPEKADIFENLFLDAHDDAINIFWRLSKDKEISEKQIELYERLSSVLRNKSEIDGILSANDTLEDVLAKLEILDIVKVDKSVFRLVIKTLKDFYYSPDQVLVDVLHSTNASNIDIIKEAIDLGYKLGDCDICESVNEYNRKFISKHLKDKKMKLSDIMDSGKYIRTEDALDFANRFISSGNFEAENLSNLLSVRNSTNAEFLDYVCFDKNSNIPLEKIQNIAKNINSANIDLAMRLCTDKDLGYTADQIFKIIKELRNSDDAKIATELCVNDNFSPDKVYNALITIRLLQQDIKRLSLRQKIDLLTNLVSATPDELEIYNKYSSIDVNNIISDLSAKLGNKRDIIRIPFEQQQMFMKNILANNNKTAEDFLKNYKFEQFGKSGLPLKYTREEFTKKVEALIADLTPEEKQLVLTHFGLSEGAAGFDGLPTNKPFENSLVGQKVKEVAKKIQIEIEEFTANNQVVTGDAIADEILTGLVLGLPEFTSIVGKQQHDTHAYSVDIHTLKVLQSAMNNPLYENLSDIDKTILKIAALCHDLGKRGGIRDEGHASASAEYVLAILDKFPFPEYVKHRIIDIVENHHWFEAYNKGEISAEYVAAKCRNPVDFLIYEILAKADFENVNETFHISNSKGVTNQAEFDKFMQDKMIAIDEALSLMYSKANLVFDTQFMHGGEKFPRETAIVDGEKVELKVLDLNKLSSNTDLQQYGFSKGVTRDNARFTVHMTTPEKGALEAVYVLTQSSLNNSTWSTSLIKYTNNRTYCNQRFGFIFNVDQANISEAYYSNIGSGTQKDFNNFKTILFDINSSARTFVKEALIKELKSKGINLTDEEYSQLVKYLMTKKYATQITNDIKIGDKVIKAEDLVVCIEHSRDALFIGGDIHNEIVSINPRITGLVAKVKNLSECPPEFLRLAKEHDLPIVLMRPAKDEKEW